MTCFPRQLRFRWRRRWTLGILAICSIGLVVVAQQALSAPNGPLSAQGANSPSGGAANADFETLIDLIVSTVDSETWQENGTGQGEIMPFAINGVSIDVQRRLHIAPLSDARVTRLAAAAQKAKRPRTQNGDKAGVKSTAKTGIPEVRRTSPLRVISLSRLEGVMAQRQRDKQSLDASMLTLAGLRRVQLVIVDEASHELWLAGPAGDWTTSDAGALLAHDTGRPLVRLDDLLVLWRRERSRAGAAFGCSIVPRQEALAQAQDYLASSAATPLEPSRRSAWLQGLRDAVGEHDVEFYQIDGDSRVAGVLLAADYHMKLIGMGLAKGVPGVRSYLSTLRLSPEGVPPATAVLRWWFALKPMELATNESRTAFEMPGASSVQVLSENEMLAERGQRVHTHASEDLNRRYADSFTAQFEALSVKYPIYGELAQMFELAVVTALIEREGLADRSGWTPSLLLDAERLRLPRMAVPTTVETVINHRVLAGRHIVAGVSGGVWVESGKVQGVRDGASAGLEGAALGVFAKSRPVEESAWWWDCTEN